jgi:hypothetical protein
MSIFSNQYVPLKSADSRLIRDILHAAGRCVLNLKAIGYIYTRAHKGLGYGAD